MDIVIENAAETIKAIRKQERDKWEARDKILAELESSYSVQPSVSPLPKRKPSVSRVALKRRTKKRKALINSIRDLFPHFDQDQEFEVPEVEKLLLGNGVVIKAKAPRASIATSMHKLENSGEVICVDRGKGGEPNKYRLAASEPMNNEGRGAAETAPHLSTVSQPAQ